MLPAYRPPTRIGTLPLPPTPPTVPSAMNFCSHCGAPVSRRIPPGDTLPRAVCDHCHTIHYENPKLVVGCIPEWTDGRILLCRRAIEPRLGLWTLPAGFMENDETTEQAAARETLEEAEARVDISDLLALVNIPYINQVHLFYRGRLRDPHFGAGEESLEVALFHQDDIPWDELAFRSVTFALRAFFHDRTIGSFGLHNTDLPPPDPSLM